ncbi:protein translocase subunit SecD [Acetobacter suratthaniensis]|uniref:Protein translocase subunit SecD n=1 Tax=Acetobacter suratthaniensis TaxID=1502841 RepID=A0ABS3LI96_9PROT|nr:protein translocase subunit SecD [Acetobacter suratthaniensis]MBO1327326.1 protein translocase subunit SecD [Acetobacter suratthaniensis]MCX2565061.1 protein translocase subunit SecD [Acetobacter suratthaniensis]
MYYSRLKLASVLGVCLLGLLLCLPNGIRKPSSLSIPWRQIHLGLDLRGGSYLLMQVDLPSLTHDRLQTLSENMRDILLQNHLGYQDFRIDADNATVSFLPRSAEETQAGLKALETLPRLSAAEFTVVRQDNGRIALTLSPESIATHAREAVTQSIEIVRRRIDGTGAIDPEITRQGDDRIVVELPGISDPERIKALLGTTAKMSFRLIDANPLHTTYPPTGVQLLSMANPADGPALPVYDHVDVDGADLTNAAATLDPKNNEWAVSFAFNSVGARAFASVTQANVGQRFAIVLDNKIIEAPVIRTPITGGDGQITGGFTAQKATDLALMLRAGALPAPLSVVEQRSIGPSLGADSIRAGMISLGVGFALVVAFMVLFYGRFGWYADIALLANLVLMAAILSLFEATLTLPGMAGMLLTLGMAVDANILINERIREEVARGRTPLAAMQAGFERATSTIVDSNATALLAHVMLFVFGTGPVRGFALTITIGIVTTLFTTLLLSRILMARWYALTRPTSLPV